MIYRMTMRDKSQEPLDPDDHPKEIVNVVSDTVNVDQVLEIGYKQMSVYKKHAQRDSTTKYHVMVKNQADEGKLLKVGGVKLFDTELIYSREIGF